MALPLAQRVLKRAQDHQERFLARLAQAVAIDSGSSDAEGVNQVGALAAGWLRELGAHVTALPAPRHGDGAPRAGDTVVGRVTGSGTARFLLFAHLDTVFAAGTAAQRPFVLDDGGLAWGPGVADDKAGVVFGIELMDHLLALSPRSFASIELVLMPDEEIGSPTSSEALVARSVGIDLALCLECARENGDIVVGRKAAADVEVRVTGVAAHAGIEPERGADAGLEAARIVEFVAGLRAPEEGLSLTVGRLRAGDRLNVVPADAVLEIDVRAPREDQVDAALERLRERVSHTSVAGTHAELSVPWRIAPMRSSSALTDAITRLLGVGEELGQRVGTATTGGVSDANAVAAHGTPVLDGMGPVGGGDHSAQEWLDTTSVAPRLAMAASLMDDVAVRASPAQESEEA